jgi:copper(I)-binding protein
MSVRALAFALMTTLFCAGAHAGVTVSNPWVRGVVAGQSSTGAYLSIITTSPTTLVRVATPLAQSAEIHEMMMHGDMMMMRPVKNGIPIPANGKVDLDPNGFHIMLLGLRKPFVNGDHVPLSLTFKDGAGVESTVTVDAVVHPLAEGADADSMKM